MALTSSDCVYRITERGIKCRCLHCPLHLYRTEQSTFHCIRYHRAPGSNSSTNGDMFQNCTSNHDDNDSFRLTNGRAPKLALRVIAHASCIQFCWLSPWPPSSNYFQLCFELSRSSTLIYENCIHRWAVCIYSQKLKEIQIHLLKGTPEE